MPPKHELRSESLGFSGRGTERLAVALVVHPDPRTTLSEKAHDGHPALAEPDDHRLFPRELHRHLNFNVARLNTASTIAIIQNRTMTLGSGQPFFSKWW